MIQTHRWATAALVVVTIAGPRLSPAETRHVPADYPTIQACISATYYSPGDECVVAPGVYHETIHTLGRPVTLRSSGGPDVTIIDGTGLADSVVFFTRGEGPDTVFDGFTITGGTGHAYEIEPVGITRGGGMLISDSSPTVTNCIFRANRADYGGAIWNERGSPVLTNCAFIGNSAAGGGGGMWHQVGSPALTNCTFSGNTAATGGAILNANGTLSLTNCTFSGNTAEYMGGAIWNGGSNPTLTNCTFSGNTVSRGFPGGAMYNDTSNPSVSNCVFWLDAPDEIAHEPGTPPPIAIRFSNVQGGLPNGAVDGGGNIDLPPMFLRAPDPGPDGTWDGVNDDYGDLRLRFGSPAINAGDPDYPDDPHATAEDHDGYPRVVGGRVDMGAYEFPGPCDGPDFDDDGVPDSCDPDLDDDGVPNGPDRCPFTPPGIVVDGEGRPLADLTRDCIVDLRDFALFQNSLFGP